MREWFGRPLWEMSPQDADGYFSRHLRAAMPGTKARKSAGIAVYFEFLELRHKPQIHLATGFVAESSSVSWRCGPRRCGGRSPTLATSTPSLSLPGFLDGNLLGKAIAKASRHSLRKAPHTGCRVMLADPGLGCRYRPIT